MDLRRLQLAWAAAAVGGWVFMVTLAVHAYAVGGAAAVGLAALVRMAPAGLAAPLTGLLADRLPRRDVLLTSALIRAVLLIACAFAPFPLLLVLAVAFTIAQTAHKPAQAALLPHLTRDPAAANAVWASIDNAAFVLGALAGGTIVAALGVPTAFAAAGLTFVLAAVLVLQIPRDRVTPCEATSSLAGVRVVARDPRLRVLVGVLSASTLIEGMVDVLVVVIALQVIDLGDGGVGWLNAAWGVGGVIGGAFARGGGLRLGCVLVGTPLIALALVPSAVTALAFLAILGAGYALVEVAGLTLLQRLADDAVRARAFAVVESSYWLTTGAGAMLAPLVIAVAGPRGALAIVGAALPLLALARLTRQGGELASPVAYTKHASVSL